MSVKSLFAALIIGLALWTHPSDVRADGPTGPQGDGNAKKLQGRPIATTAPTSGQVMAWNGTAWAPAAGSGGASSLQAAYDGGRTILTASAGTPVAITGAGTGVALVVTSGVMSAPGAGASSERFGAGSVADGDGSAVFGNAADDANYNYTTGVGSSLVVGGAQGVLLGTGATTGGNNAITEGYSASGSASGLIVIGAFGFGSSSATDGIGIGKGVSVNATQSLVVGGGSATDGSTAFDGSTVAGYDASGGGVRATAYGFSANAVARAVGVGGLSDAAYAYSVAIGYNSLIAGNGGIALGPEMQAPANTFVMGGSAATVGATGVNVAVIGGTGSAAASHPTEVKWRPTDGSGAANAGTGLFITTGISGDASTASGALDLGVAVVGSATAATRVVRIDPTYGQMIVGGNLAATSGKVAVFHGDVDITGVLDPTAVVLSDNTGGTDVYLEAADGTGASVAGTGKGRIRYLSGTGWQMSSAGGAYSTAVTAANLAANLPTSVIVDGGNTTGATVTVGTNDAQSLVFETSGTTRITLGTASLVSTFPITLPAGSASATSVQFTSDPNTGLYSPGADSCALVTGGTARLTLSTSAMTTTLPLRGQDGSVSAPALSFSGDTNCGIYRVTTDTIGLATAGVSRLQINASGALLLMGSSSGSVGFVPPAAAGSTTYTLPSADGTAGQALTTNGTATLSWATPSGGSLDAAYDFGGAGAGRTINADAGDVNILPSGTGGISCANATAGGAYGGQQFGPATDAASPSSLVVGHSSTTSGASGGGLVFGMDSDAVLGGGYTSVFGTSSTASGNGVLVLGGGSAGTADQVTLVGTGNTGSATGATGVGYGIVVTGLGGSLLGGSGSVTHDGSIGLGWGVASSATNQLAVGSASYPITTIALGYGGTSTASGATLLLAPTETTAGSAAGGTLTVSGGAAPSGTGGNLILQGGTGSAAGTVTVAASGQSLGFFGTTPAAKPTITGSRGGNAALASLLTAGATLGLWTDSTSP